MRKYRTQLGFDFVNFIYYKQQSDTRKVWNTTYIQTTYLQICIRIMLIPSNNVRWKVKCESPQDESCSQSFVCSREYCSGGCSLGRMPPDSKGLARKTRIPHLKTVTPAHSHQTPQPAKTRTEAKCQYKRKRSPTSRGPLPSKGTNLLITAPRPCNQQMILWKQFPTKRGLAAARGGPGPERMRAHAQPGSPPG